MALDHLEVVSRFTAIIAESRGARTDCQQIVDELTQHLDVVYGFVCIEAAETERLDVLAASGLDVNDFRRLDARAGASALIRIFDLTEPTYLLVNDEPSLDFLVRPGIVAEIVSVPIMTGRTCVGAISIGFDKTTGSRSSDTVKLLEIAAALISQTLRSDTLANEESRRLAAENVHLKQELKDKYDFGNLIGNSNQMRQAYDQVTQVARSSATVLLRGESGTGKELIANAIHYNSLRSKRPFVKINCAAFPGSLIETELLGDAQTNKKGRFELADGGTIFLDEIADLPVQTQMKLLRVLQEREFESVGGLDTIKSNVRLIAATNIDLEDEIADGNFREDLFYRLNMFTIFLPPLRDRKSDILLLADHFLEKYAAEHGKPIRRISTPAIDMLTAYHFPGNVPELENAVERAVLACDTQVIHGHHLPPTLQTAEVTDTVTRITLASAVEAFERDMIQDALKSSRGNVARAAKMLDSTERILGYKIKKYAIDALRFKKWTRSTR
ncbi:MAG: sigma 54-interacting transcriptional regulator [Pyrinomonadaceae bacterium]